MISYHKFTSNFVHHIRCNEQRVGHDNISMVQGYAVPSLLSNKSLNTLGYLEQLQRSSIPITPRRRSHKGLGWGDPAGR